MSDEASRQSPVLEVQIHPGSTRWGVQYLFFSKRRLRMVGGAVATLAVFILFSLIVTPVVIANIVRQREYRSLISEREMQGQRVQALSAELEAMSSRADELRLRMSRIHLTYGLSSDESLGHGGFPFEESQPVQSIYAADVQRGRQLQIHLSEQLAVVEAFVGEVESFESAHSDQVRTTPSISPLKAGEFVLTSPFGSRRSPFTKRVDLHPGLDLAAETGTEIRAPADGVVVFSGRYPVKQSVAWWRYGNLVAIRHGERFITLFGHCNEIQVRNGESIAQNGVIATVGNTGWSTSPHLHYEVRRLEEDGRFVPVDPRVYILDYRWRDEERFLVRARTAPDLSGYEPLPRLIKR